MKKRCHGIEQLGRTKRRKQFAVRELGNASDKVSKKPAFAGCGDERVHGPSETLKKKVGEKKRTELRYFES